MRPEIGPCTAVIDAAMIDAAPRLRVIGRSGVGVERVDLRAATEHGIPVVIAPKAGTRAVAEETLALMLHLVKRLGQIAGALGMRIVVNDPYLGLDALDPRVTRADLPDLMASVDVVSLHAPLTPETKGLIGRLELERIRPGAVLVNCGRGELLDLNAAYDALCDGRLGGVGLDVFDPEPPKPHPLFDHPDVVLTPRVMPLSRRARGRLFAEMADEMATVLDGGRAPHVANPDVYAKPESGNVCARSGQ